MNIIIDIVRDKLQKTKNTEEEQLQLNKVCQLENNFSKYLSKDKTKEFFNLDFERGKLIELEINRVILIAYKTFKELYNC